MSEHQTATVATAEDKSGCASVNGYAASLNIEEIFGTLKAAEMFIAVHKPTPYSETCECGSCRVSRTLKNVREVMRHNDQAQRPPTKTHEYD